MPGPPHAPRNLDVRLLGRLEVCLGDATIHFPREKVAHLLVYLLLHRNVPPRVNQLADALWPDQSETVARANLRKRLYDLVQILPEPADGQAWFERKQSAIWWNDAAAVTVDVDEFELLCRRARLSSGERPAGEIKADLDQAIALYHGDLVPDLADDWIVAFRERLRNHFHQALAQLLELQLAEGDLEAAQLTAEGLAEREPLREAPRRALMWLSATTGEDARALALYDAYRTLLRQSLGIEPSPATTSLADAIRAGQSLDGWSKGGVPTTAAGAASRRSPASTAATLSRNLPFVASSFVGREREIEEVLRHLSLSRMLTLMGAGGSGKTRLALEVAGRVQEQYADGVAWVELEAISNPEMVANEVARVLGVATSGKRPPLALIAEQLQDRAMLLVFDNCEHLVPGVSPVVEALLAAGPGIHVLATSRVKVGVDGEATWLVPPLTLPPAGEYLTEAELTTSEAVRLFIERVRDVWPEFATPQPRLKTIGQICRQLEGIPLAIELAAARVSVLTVEDIAGRLKASFDVLRSQDRAHPDRHQTLTATIEWSHRLLTVPEQVLLSRLSVFSDGFTMSAAAAVVQGEAFGVRDVLAGEDVFDLVGRLVDKSFVTVDPRHTRMRRFRLLEMIRQFGRRQMAVAGEDEVLARRHAEYYVGLAEQAEPHFAGAEAEKWLSLLDAEQNDVRQAMQWMEDQGEWEMAVRLGAAMRHYWYTRGRVQYERKWMEHVGVFASELPPSSSLADFFLGSGALAYLQYDLPATRRGFAASMMQFKVLGDRRKSAALLHNLGTVHMLEGDLAQARRLSEEALELRRELGDASEIAVSMRTIADIAHCQGEYHVAYGLLEQCKAIIQGVDTSAFDQLEIARALTYVTHSRGALSEAVSYLDEWEALSREIGYTDGLANSLNSRGRVLTDLGRYDEASTYLRQALSLWNDLKLEGSAALVIHNLGDLALRTGDLAVARTYLVRSLAIKESLGNEWDATFTHILLGALAMVEGDIFRANSHLERAKELADRFHAPSLVAHVTLIRVQVCLMKHDLPLANLLLGQCLEQFHKMGEMRSMAVALDVATDYAVTIDQYDRAAHIAGAVSALRTRLATPRTHAEKSAFARNAALIHNSLGPKAAKAAETAGAQTDLAELVSGTVIWLTHHRNR